MTEKEIKEFVIKKTDDYFSNECNKLAEFRANRLLTSHEYNSSLNSLLKNKKIFNSILNEIL